VSRLLTVLEVAEYLAVHPNTVRNMISSNELASLKIRGTRRIELDEVERYLAARREGRNTDA
jgi:excisionase family DNA binding protein